MNKAAQTLGRLAAGKPKNYTAAELARRKKRLADARLKRWKKPEASDAPANGELTRGAQT